MTALAMRIEGIPPATKIVLYWLADHHNGETGACFPSLNTLARLSEMGRNTVVRHLELLEERGVISRYQRFRDNGSQTSTAYELHLTPVPKRNSPCSKMEQPPVPKWGPHNLGNNNLGNEQEVSSIPCAVDDGFDDFWEAYPHRNGVKKNRKAALAAFSKAKKTGATIEAIAVGIEAMKTSPDVLRGYARDPTSWLNQEGWKDEIPKTPMNGISHDKPRNGTQTANQRIGIAANAIARGLSDGSIQLDNSSRDPW